MPIATTFSEFVNDNSDWINALLILLVACAIAKFADVLMMRNSRRMRAKFENDEISQATVTRLRLVRRLITATIVLIGIGLALAQIDALQPLATALLASSAVVGVAVGLASRAVLANGVSGMMLATVQPFRIGDVIEWDGNRGRVEDITLTYTFIRLPSGHRLVVPNEAIATSPLENFTIAGNAVDADASIWVVPTHATKALTLLRDKMQDIDINLGECEQHRIELKLGFASSAQDEAAKRFATREQAIGLLSDAGMLEAAPEPG